MMINYILESIKYKVMVIQFLKAIVSHLGLIHQAIKKSKKTLKFLIFLSEAIYSSLKPLFHA